MQECTTHKNNGINNYNIKETNNLLNTIFRLFSMIFQDSKVTLIIQFLSSIIGGLLPVIVAIQWKNILSIISINLETLDIKSLVAPFLLLSIVRSFFSIFSIFF